MVEPIVPTYVTSTKIDYTPVEATELEIKQKTEWTGDAIKKVREYKNLGLDKISEITRISSYYINAIEKMDGKNLPASVFVRGYVSQLSKVLGLDEKRVCDSYMRNFKSSLEKK